MVPSQMKKLAPEKVVVRPLKERAMVMTAALARNNARHHLMVDVAVKWLANRE